MVSARRRTAWATGISTACGALALALGVAVLSAWWFGIEPLVQPLPTFPEMDPSTAVWLVLLGCAQLLLRNPAVGFSR